MNVDIQMWVGGGMGVKNQCGRVVGNKMLNNVAVTIYKGNGLIFFI